MKIFKKGRERDTSPFYHKNQLLLEFPSDCGSVVLLQGKFDSVLKKYYQILGEIFQMLQSESNILPTDFDLPSVPLTYLR